MQKVAVVFDSNVYRDLFRPTSPLLGTPITSIRQKEEKQGIVAYASVFVAMELLSRLHDPVGPGYQQCRDAITALHEHCCEGEGPEFRILAPSESLIARALYGKDLPGYAENTEKIAKLTSYVAQAPVGPLDQKAVDACKGLATFIDETEAGFVADMAKAARALNPKATGWNPFQTDAIGRKKALSDVRAQTMPYRIAVMHVIKVRQLLDMPLHDVDMERDAVNVLSMASASVFLYRNILEKLVTTGCDLSKPNRANWWWDMQIAIAVGQEVGNPALPLTLVTSDGAILDAAIDAGIAGRVIKLSDYVAAL